MKWIPRALCLLVLAFFPAMHALAAPGFQATANPSTGPAPLTVSFQAFGPPPLFPNQVRGTFRWDFGDQTRPETGPSVSHTYTVPRNYTVTVTYDLAAAMRAETTGQGNLPVRNYYQLFVSVTGSKQTQVPLNLQMRATPVSGPVPLTVRFRARGSPPADDSSRADYYWYFGDGASAAGPSVTHVYRQPGEFQSTVTYTRYDNGVDGGRPEQVSKTVPIFVLPQGTSGQTSTGTSGQTSTETSGQGPVITPVRSVLQEIVRRTRNFLRLPGDRVLTFLIFIVLVILAASYFRPKSPRPGSVSVEAVTDLGSPRLKVHKSLLAPLIQIEIKPDAGKTRSWLKGRLISQRTEKIPDHPP
jgi:hypothetical protein